MNPLTILTILELINKIIAEGGTLVPVALKALEAIRSEPSMTDDELIAAAEDLNAKDKKKLETLLGSLP